MGNSRSSHEGSQTSCLLGDDSILALKPANVLIFLVDDIHPSPTFKAMDSFEMRGYSCLNQSSGHRAQGHADIKHATTARDLIPTIPGT